MGKAEATEIDAEVVPEPGALALNQEFEGIIRLADRLDNIGKAKDKIRRFVLGRAYPGDWIRFGDKCELGGPGAERVASDLGVSFRNWRDWKDSGGDENGKWYTWWYETDAECQGRVLQKVQGRASSRDKFFGYENGAWKLLADCREADIRTAARRCAMKEGTKLMFGLRAIPWDHAEALGLDPKKVKTVEFGSGAKSKGKAGAKVTFKAKIVDVNQKTIKTKSIVYVISLDSKKYPIAETFSESLAKSAKALKGKLATVGIEESKFAPKLQSIVAVKSEEKAEDKDG